MALTILSTSPVAGSSSHQIDDPIAIIFDLALNPDTVTESRFILYRAPYTLVPCTLEYVPSMKMVQMIPENFLLPNTTYSVLLAGGYGGIAAFDGTNIAGGNYTFNFTTAPGLIPSGTYIIGGEYFVDTLGSSGTGTSVSAVDTAFDSEWEQFYSNITLSALTVGTHRLYVHARDNSGIWGTVQYIDFELTNSGPTSYTSQSAFTAHILGPSTTSLMVSPSPTGGSPTALLTGIFTTRNLIQIPISGELPSTTATEYLSVVETDPANLDSLVTSETVTITFNYPLSESYND